MAQDDPIRLVTGCSTGMGRALTEVVAARGWRPALNVTDGAQIAAVVAAARDRFGGLDVLADNAGYGNQRTAEQGQFPAKSYADSPTMNSML